jgi:hypothetical protein
LRQEQGTTGEEAALTLGASGLATFFTGALPNVRWTLLYGVLLCNAHALGEFGAVSVVSGHIRGLTNTKPSPWPPSPSSNGDTATPSLPATAIDHRAGHGTALAITARGISKSFGETAAVSGRALADDLATVEIELPVDHAAHLGLTDVRSVGPVPKMSNVSMPMPVVRRGIPMAAVLSAKWRRSSMPWAHSTPGLLDASGIRLRQGRSSRHSKSIAVT